jgi:hypothetical protein
MARKFGLLEGETSSWVDKGVNLLLLVVAAVAIGAVLWIAFGPKADRCKGVPAGAVVEDQDNPGSYKPICG